MKSLVGAARLVRWGAGVAGAVCIVVAVVGCGSETVEGSPATATQSGQPSFDPCTLSDEALVGAGVDPATKDPDVFGVQMKGWEVCTWAGDWFFLNVLSATIPFDEVRTNANNVEVTEVEIGDRTAVTYHERTDPDMEFCDVAFAVEDGSVIVRIDTKGGMTAKRETCAAAIDAASVLQTYIPD